MAASAQKRAAPPVEGVNFLDLGMYVAGGGLPDYDYCLFFTVQMYQAQNAAGANQGPPRLGVMVEAYPLDNPVAENAKHQFYSMGSNADKSFAPNPETGKGLVAIPGAPAATLNNSTNWSLFLKSLYDCGLPQNIALNDISVLDGIWVHTTQVPEPEERKGFGASQTGEAAQPDRGPKRIAVVTEIKDDGKPWDGTGGIPAVPAAKPNGSPAAAMAKTPPAKTAPKPPAKVAAPAAAPVADAEALQLAAQNGVSAVLEKNPNGCPRLLLRTQTFGAVKATDGEDMASAVIDTYFRSDDKDAALNGLLGLLGYTCAGGAIKVT